MSSNKQALTGITAGILITLSMGLHAQVPGPQGNPPAGAQPMAGQPAPSLAAVQSPAQAPAPAAAERKELKSTGVLHEASRLQGQQFISDLTAKVEKSKTDAEKARAERNKKGSTDAPGGKRDFVVVEIYGFNDRMGAEIQFTDDNTLARIRKGAMVGGWKVEKITPQEVVVSDGKSSKSMSIAFSGHNPNAVNNPMGLPPGAPLPAMPPMPAR